MAKTSQTRINDCLTYLSTHFGQYLADEIQGLINGQQAAISDELSLGARWDGLSSNNSKSANTQRRHALRSLLLCQRVYFSDLWPSMHGIVSNRVAYNWLPANWKQQSLNHWGSRSEHELRGAIRAFVATSDNVDYAANAALNGQPSAPAGAPLGATRQNCTGHNTATCYDAVMLWLFKSGLVSLRWLMKYRNANTKQYLEEAFGKGRVIWNGNFGSNDRLPNVPRGHVVHMFEHEQSWRGHWMISTGNGHSAGCNNNDENPPVPRDYCAKLTLNKQMLDFGRGKAIVINPVLIPGRL